MTRSLSSYVIQLTSHVTFKLLDFDIVFKLFSLEYYVLHLSSIIGWSSYVKDKVNRSCKNNIYYIILQNILQLRATTITNRKIQATLLWDMGLRSVTLVVGALGATSLEGSSTRVSSSTTSSVGVSLPYPETLPSTSLCSSLGRALSPSRPLRRSRTASSRLWSSDIPSFDGNWQFNSSPLFPRERKFSFQPLGLPQVIYHLSLQKLVGTLDPLELQVGLLWGLRCLLLVVIRGFHLLGKSCYLTLRLISLFFRSLNLSEGKLNLTASSHCLTLISSTSTFIFFNFFLVEASFSTEDLFLVWMSMRAS